MWRGAPLFNRGAAKREAAKRGAAKRGFKYTTGRLLRVYKSFGRDEKLTTIFLNLGFSDLRRGGPELVPGWPGTPSAMIPNAALCNSHAQVWQVS